MREVGVVVSDSGKFATVKVDKKDECSKCGMCLFPKGADGITFNAENTAGAKTGDAVVVEREKDGKLLGAILAFLVPLLLIGVSTIVGYVVIKKEIWVLILSVLSIVTWYCVLALIDKKLVKTVGYKTKIVSVIKNAEQIDKFEKTKGEYKND